MLGSLINWFTNQIALTGPFAYAVENGWISSESAEWIGATFFAPLNFAAKNSESLHEQLAALVEAWRQLPF